MAPALPPPTREKGEGRRRGLPPAGAEQVSTYADNRRSLGDRRLHITGHSHRQGVGLGHLLLYLWQQLSQLREIGALLVRIAGRRRNGHEPPKPQACHFGDCLYQFPKCVWHHAGLAVLGGQVDL